MTCSRNLASFGFSAENLISASQVPHCIYKQEKHLCPKMGQKETGLKIITVPIQTQTRMYDSALHVFPDVKFGRDTINSKKSNKMTYLFQSHYSDHTQKNSYQTTIATAQTKRMNIIHCTNRGICRKVDPNRGKKAKGNAIYCISTVTPSSVVLLCLPCGLSPLQKAKRKLKDE